MHNILLHAKCLLFIFSSRSLKIGPLVTFPAGSGTYPVHTSSKLLGFANGFSTVTCDVCCETLNIPQNMTQKILPCSHCKEDTVSYGC